MYPNQSPMKSNQKNTLSVRNKHQKGHTPSKSPGRIPHFNGNQNTMNPFNQNPYTPHGNMMGKNAYTTGFNLGDSFIPGLQKFNLRSKKMIWDDHPGMNDFYGLVN